MSQRQHFDRLAVDYDARRLVERGPDVVAELDRLVALNGRRLLDIGCGTGWTLATAMARHGCRGVGIDPSPAMVRVARDRGVDARLGAAEALPFGPASFDLALMQLVIHHVERGRALAEAQRVLTPGGALVIVTRPPESVAEDWATQYLPSYARVGASRFPSIADLEAEATSAGFAAVDHHARSWTILIRRDEALAAMRSRASSIHELLPDGELGRGIARAEAAMPDSVESRYTLVFLVGRA